MIGERLKQLRIQNKKTHKDVASALMISRQAYGFYENEKRTPDIEALSRLAQFYGVSISYILGESENAGVSDHQPGLAISAKLIELRKQIKKSQAAVASDLKISQQAYSFYENNKRSPDYETLRKIAAYYNVSMAYLLGETNQKNFSSNIPPSNDTVVTANPDIVSIKDLSTIERVFFKAYLQLDHDIRQKLVEHFTEALDTHREELTTQKDIEAELDRYRLELEAERLGKTSSASGGRKRDLG